MTAVERPGNLGLEPRDLQKLGDKNSVLTERRYSKSGANRGCWHYAANSSSWREIPRNSKRRINVSSIKLFGHDAPAVIPITAGPFGNQKCETTSRFSCRL